MDLNLLVNLWIKEKMTRLFWYSLAAAVIGGLGWWLFSPIL